MSADNSTVTYKDIPGFPGYRVGDDGSVWSAWKRVVTPGKGAAAVIGSDWRRMKVQRNARGYLRLHLRSAGGKKEAHYVHRLVLLAFVGPPPAGAECLHGPGGPGDNRPHNLRWGTHAENVSDAVASGVILRGEKQPNAKLTDADVREARRLHAEEGWTCVRLARRFNVADDTMGSLLRGKRWKHLSGTTSPKQSSPRPTTTP